MRSNWWFLAVALILLVAVYIVYTNSLSPWEDIEHYALAKATVIPGENESRFVLFYDDLTTKDSVDAAVVYTMGSGKLSYVVFKDGDMWVKWDAVRHEVIEIGPVVPEKKQEQVPNDSTQPKGGSAIPPQLFSE